MWQETRGIPEVIVKLKEATTKVRLFVEETTAEVKRATWPSREELTESTVVVIVTLVIIGLFVGVCDWFLIGMLKWIVP
jgi:preprotein translocase subunit SecE